MRVLLLGGTAEANALARLFAARPQIEAMLSLAGRTAAPAPAPIPSRVGGFGGTAGLARFLQDRRIDVLVDATHPFAAVISENAARAAAAVRRPLVRLVRPPWTAREGDRWRFAPDMAAAARLIGAAPRRVFLTIGRQQLAAFETAPQHSYLIRGIEPVVSDLPDYRFVSARGPFSADDEEALLRAEAIEAIVAKNSGSPAVYGKIEAARRLRLPVIMVERPPAPRNLASDAWPEPVADPAAALDATLRLGEAAGAAHRALAPRGV